MGTYAMGNGQLCQMTMAQISNTLDCMHDQQAIIRERERDEMDSRKYMVRRLTPVQCQRLQGFPDGYTDGVPGSETAQYKMWGNGIALPCAVDVLWRIAHAVQPDVMAVDDLLALLEAP